MRVTSDSSVDSFGFVWFRLVSFGFVSFRFVSFGFVWFRLVPRGPVRCISVRVVSIRFGLCLVWFDLVLTRYACLNSAGGNVILLVSTTYFVGSATQRRRSNGQEPLKYFMQISQRRTLQHDDTQSLQERASLRPKPQTRDQNGKRGFAPGLAPRSHATSASNTDRSLLPRK